MITVGLIKELAFLASVFGEAESSLLVDGREISLKISNKTLEVSYKGEKIWQETLNDELSFFGIESCDTISRIIACIDNQTSWEKYRWQENTLQHTQEKSV